MGRIECEKKIIQKMREIMDIYHEYNPDGKRLSMFILNDYYSVDNSYWEDDAEHPISAWESDKWGYTQGSLGKEKKGAEA